MATNKPTTRYKINVTHGDIERAKISDSYRCVVVQAIARTITDATNIDVDTQSIRFTREGARFVYLTPYAVQGYVIAFDAGDVIEPFSFQLRDPAKVKRQVRTEAGKAADRAARRARTAAKIDTPNKGVDSPPVSKSAKIDTPNKGVDSPPAVRTQVPLTKTPMTKDEARQAATAAYAISRQEHANAPVRHSDGGGRKAPPRVFKSSRRAYGHRLLRINQDLLRTEDA